MSRCQLPVIGGPKWTLHSSPQRWEGRNPRIISDLTYFLCVFDSLVIATARPPLCTVGLGVIVVSAPFHRSL